MYSFTDLCAYLNTHIFRIFTVFYPKLLKAHLTVLNSLLDNFLTCIQPGATRFYFGNNDLNILYSRSTIKKIQCYWGKFCAASVSVDTASKENLSQ